ncbi:hypothetical protein Pst134EA_028975 [Puccinia striiformis f. sp. tritici]|uniref:hypothetical protein n=1 Tax=Puccinia striiformis f. sp. tritici TaxID=168172 RepID=UPI00200770A2|nr:hypothetical protein Pst134EA_028975 [Puccinia striiformis f. sp. tritici]KAH9446991.1 hypothetical protein Pst134EA_028975 [Puccinia striiformis f. sp. tritici]
MQLEKGLDLISKHPKRKGDGERERGIAMACVKGASRAGAMMRREDQDGDGDEDMKYGGNRSVIEFSDGIMVGKGAPDIQEGQEEGKAVILYPITP